jgi:4-amino-4-deoxy-L-arabinose transferase-like glycosyltransferase
VRSLRDILCARLRITRNQCWVLAYIAVAITGLVRVALTHRVFSHVADEPTHIACGYQWLTTGNYKGDTTHPPLERVLSALPAVLLRKGSDVTAADPLAVIFHKIIEQDGNYERNLAYARLGNLLFMLTGTLATGFWVARYFGKGAGLLATSMFVSLPPILGHAGVATTDLAITSMIPAAILTLERWIDLPSPGRAVLLGLAVGVGALSKFSFLLFFPIGCAIVIGTRFLCKTGAFSAKSLSLAIIVAALVVWSGYRFQVTTMALAHERGEGTMVNLAPKPLKSVASSFARQVPIPAPLFVIGAGKVQLHNRNGHLACLFGEIRQYGWWYYFPVVVFYKTPLPFLALAIVGILLLCFRDRQAMAFALIPVAFLLAVLPSSINIGVRHVLPIYPALCACAAWAVLTLWRINRLRLFAMALLVWFFAGSLLAHPDYLAWFNEAAGHHPEKIVADSNLDWGQDMLRLGRILREKHIPAVYSLCFESGALWRNGIELNSIHDVPPETPGWFALGLTPLAFDAEARRGAYSWLNSYQYTMVGKSIRLYHVPGSSP